MKAAKEHLTDIGDGGEWSEVKRGDGDEIDKRKYGPKGGRNGRENTHDGDRVRGWQNRFRRFRKRDMWNGNENW